MNGEQVIPPGVDFVWDQAEMRLADQLSQADALDRKLGVLLTLLGVSVGLVATVIDRLTAMGRVVAVVVVIGLAVSAAFALAAFRTRQYDRSPQPEEMWRFAIWDAEWVKYRFLSTRFRALERNRQRLSRKALLSSASTWVFTGVASIVTLATIVELAS